jgi:UDP-N-acetyl-D-mannosaminuronate dehydrogenase
MSKPHFDSEKILVVGLGQLGLPIAKYIRQSGFDTYGYDISPKAMDKAEKEAGDGFIIRNAQRLRTCIHYPAHLKFFDVTYKGRR